MSLVAINWKPARSQLRQFGALCLIVFGAVGMLIYAKHTFFRIPMHVTVSHAVGLVVACFGVMCGFAALIAPQILRPVYIALTLIALPIGYVVSLVILALMFYGVITPIGLFMRLIGRDTMQRKLQPGRASYWEPRQPVIDMQRYFRQS